LSTPDETFSDFSIDKNGNRKYKDITISKGYIRDSSKPEMAKNIFDNYEHQALFMGDLNPNMIKRVWVKLRDRDENDPLRYNYIPMSRKAFYKMVKNMEFYGDYGSREKIRNQKLFYPTEDVISKENVAKKYYERFNRMHGDSLEDTVKWLDDVGFFDGEKLLYNTSTDYIRELFWPKQIIQLFGKDFFDKYFNRLGQV
jgi:hypothetical protein